VSGSPWPMHSFVRQFVRGREEGGGTTTLESTYRGHHTGDIPDPSGQWPTRA
jgi:hypothetical protein